MSIQPLILSISEAAKLLGLKTAQLYELSRTRSRANQKVPLPVIKMGRRLVFRRSDLEKWIADLAAACEVRP